MVSREPIRRQTVADLDGMTGTEFERFLGIIFRNLGYQVTKASRRQGADLAVEQFGERTLVQVKRCAEGVPQCAVDRKSVV